MTARNFMREDWDRFGPVYQERGPSGPSTPAQDARHAQMQAARDSLNATSADFLHFPWPDLDGIVRGIAPGSCWFLAGFSGVAGKTTFLTSLALEWVSQDTSVYYVPLETPPSEIWVRLACLTLGVSPGMVQSGDAQLLPDWDLLRASIDRQVAMWQDFDDVPLWVHPADRADEAMIGEAAVEASMLNADVFILDHIDHLHGDTNSNDYSQSLAVTRRLDKIRKDDPSIRLLIATQLNQDAIKNDPLAKILPPLESHIKFGAHKREIADGMLGLYRPLRKGTTSDQLKAVRRRESDPMLLVEPGQMGVEIMKHRARGEMLGRQCVLGVDATGRVQHLPERDRYGTSYDDLRKV